MSANFTPAYEKLGYVALNVCDAHLSALFYEEQLGLARVGQGECGEIYLRCSDDHHNVILYPSATAGLKRAAFALENAEALRRLRERLYARGVTVCDVPELECASLHLTSAFRLSEPVTGAVLEFFCGMQASADGAYQPTLARIQRLGHLVIGTDRWPEALAFYVDVLGFKISDIIEGMVGFLRCPPNPYHHSLGIGKATRPGLHHVNFMVSEIDDIGRALWRFRKHNVDIVFGPGRHPPSESVFLYFLDPDGLTLEYSFGMETFPAELPRAHRVLPAVQESVDTWGSARDPRHGKTGAIESLKVAQP